jgi:hypothetical protein
MFDEAPHAGLVGIGHDEIGPRCETEQLGRKPRRRVASTPEEVEVGVDDRLLVGGEKPGAPQDVPVDLLTHVTAQLRGEAPVHDHNLRVISRRRVIVRRLPRRTAYPGRCHLEKERLFHFVRLN